MNKRLCVFVLALGLIAPTVMAQEIKVVWEYLNTPNTGGNPFFPFMVPKSGAPDGSGCGGQVPGYENTKFDMDIMSSLVRYDEDRLLLFVVENGINEDDPNHDAEMAANYPDRTVWWLNASDGSPIGIALEPLNLGGGGVTFTREGVEYKTIDFWPTSDFFIERALDDRSRSFRPDLLQETAPKLEVDAEGNLYITDRHNLVRYTPDGQGGFNAPTLCYEYPKVNPPVLPDGTVVTDGHYRSWSMKEVNIVGAGPNKIMTTSGRHWLDGAGISYYVSDDGGASWTYTQYKGQDQRGGVVGTGGGCSAPVTSSVWNEEYVFGTGFPGSDDFLYRMLRPAGSDEPFMQDIDDLWTKVAPDPNEELSETQRYMSWQKVSCAAVQDIPYVAVICIPKWKSLYEDWAEQGGPPTAWIALHSYEVDPDGDGVEGDFVTGYQIPWTDADEPNIPGSGFDEDAGAAWHNVYQVGIKMYVNEGYPPGAFEILWSGGGIGYGRCVVGDVPTGVSDWSLY